jgi:hypothetical protein
MVEALRRVLRGQTVETTFLLARAADRTENSRNIRLGTINVRDSPLYREAKSTQ